MKEQRIHLWALNGMGQLRALGSITLCFVLGCVAGCWCSSCLEQEGAGALREWLEGYISAQHTGAAEWVPALWQMLRFPLLLTLLQFSVLGMVFVPVLMGVRGFLFSFAVTGFVRTYAWRGMLCALLLFGPLGIVELTALFFLAEAAFLRADQMGREGGGAQSAVASPVLVAACWMALGLLALGQVLLSGMVSRGLAALLS